VPRATTIRLVREAMDLGVSVFDTAPAYGAGEAERRLGQALVGVDRDRVFLSTKAGLTSSGLARRHRDFSPDGIEISIRDSLRRLKVDGVDALFLHGIGEAELTSALFQRLNTLKGAGAFRHLGAAGRGAELSAAISSGEVELIMAPVHPFLSHTEDQRLLDAAAAGIGVVAIETSGDAPARARWPRRTADLYKLAKTLRSHSGRGRVSIEDGLQAALHRPEVRCALMTTTRPDHLRANVRLA
jgi:aryl-alcohol dehydrogenase-like predicted oxidoreductase